MRVGVCPLVVTCCCVFYDCVQLLNVCVGCVDRCVSVCRMVLSDFFLYDCVASFVFLHDGVYMCALFMFEYVIIVCSCCCVDGVLGCRMCLFGFRTLCLLLCCCVYYRVYVC